MINFRFITNLMGKLLLVESAFLLLCIIIALLYHEAEYTAFLYSTLITVAASLSLIRWVKPQDRILAKKDGYFTVTMVWIVFSFFGCLPYILSGIIPSFSNAFFETMSGFTTTGASVLNDLDTLPRSILFWRSLTQWLGGLGIILLFIAILPSLGIEGRDLYVAETTGPTHNKASFTFTLSARKMWFIYIALTLLLSGLLYLGGMDIFDSICHSFATMGTGGFSTKQASIAYWDSTYIQCVIIVFMFIAGINFGLLYNTLRGNWNKLFKENEFQLYTLLIVTVSVAIGLGLYFQGWGSLPQSLLDSTFQVVSIVTTTGFATTDYLLWPSFLCLPLLLLFFVGGSAGSTAGGFKIVRVYLLFKNSLIELKRIIHPNAIITVKYNQKTVHPNIMTNIMGFAILYIFVFIISTLIMSFFTEDIITACSAVVTSISNVGPGFGSIGPMFSFAHLNDFAKLFLAFLMLVGRLEILTVMVLFTKAFWKR